jgi:hypothetical protein
MRKLGLPVVLGLGLILTNGCNFSSGKRCVNCPTTTPSPTPTPTPGASTAFSGNYSLTATDQVSGKIMIIGGLLTGDSSGNVTGAMHVANSSCFDIQKDVVVFSGSISSAGAFTANSSPVNSQVISFTATISTDRTSITAGTFTITGGSCTGEHGTLSGFPLASLTANYNGTFNSGSNTITVSSSPLTQSTSADAQGLFHLTGTLTFSSSTCGLASATIQTSLVAGQIVELTLSGSDGLSTITFSGQAADKTGTNITGLFSIAGGVCAGQSGTATLTHP